MWQELKFQKSSYSLTLYYATFLGSPLFLTTSSGQEFMHNMDGPSHPQQNV